MVCPIETGKRGRGAPSRAPWRSWSSGRAASREGARPLNPLPAAARDLEQLRRGPVCIAVEKGGRAASRVVEQLLPTGAARTKATPISATRSVVVMCVIENREGWRGARLDELHGVVGAASANSLLLSVNIQKHLHGGRAGGDESSSPGGTGDSSPGADPSLPARSPPCALTSSRP